ncbi:MAG: PepSY domain-containing protein [Sphingomonadales bacterium]|nr:MAG: PepSY domain-containing protein [Sphingomonadales bacterium]
MIVKNAPNRLSWRRRIVSIHRWLGVAAALFWLVQAATGIAIMFHWEMQDASVAGAHRATDLAAIERRIDTLAPPGSSAKLGSLWTTAGSPDRYEIFFADADSVSRSVRIAGDGTVLQEKGPEEGSLLGTLVDIHHNLAAGKTGDWIVAVSGLLLISNLLFGLIVALPRGVRWRAALKPVSKGPAAARLYSWHRAVGLWAILPALVMVTAGTLLKFEDGFGALIGAEPVALPANPPAEGRQVGFSIAAQAALGAIPGSTLTAVSWPGEGDATYRVRVLAPGEIRRAYGASVVLVDANNGQVRGTFPIAEAQGARAFMSALFPVHTGELGGLVGRLLAIAIGVWLATMVVVGVLLWLRRRPSRRA